MITDQKIMDNLMADERFNRMKTSTQLMLGELIILLENVKNKDLPVIFDYGEYRPICLDSWRGAYGELAINYSDKESPISCAKLLKELKEAIGKTFEGYKGGDYVMGKNTPLWAANYGTSLAWCGDSRGIIGIEEREDFISITTEKMEY